MEKQTLNKHPPGCRNWPYPCPIGWGQHQNKTTSLAGYFLPKKIPGNFFPIAFRARPLEVLSSTFTAYNILPHSVVLDIGGSLWKSPLGIGHPHLNKVFTAAFAAISSDVAFIYPGPFC